MKFLDDHTSNSNGQSNHSNNKSSHKLLFRKDNASINTEISNKLAMNNNNLNSPNKLNTNHNTNHNTNTTNLKELKDRKNKRLIKISKNIKGLITKEVDKFNSLRQFISSKINNMGKVIGSMELVNKY